ncbi:MAG: hypothetical protein NZ941_00375 [Candidatus Caldarchaeum sp.]|nr:hypothetical protein [Candidatus Caldarchaeum sp.]MDW7977748.1 hypothetical protein [Candidatus Caldarchaeum sp.]
MVKDLHENSQLREEFRRDPLPVLRRYGIPEQLCEAVASKDYVRLYRMGVHPLVMFNISHIFEKNPDKYRSEVVPRLPASELD